MKDAMPLPQRAAGESPELKLMRAFSAMRHEVKRKDALAAARWMVRYASDYSIKYVGGRTRHNGRSYGDEEQS